LRKVVIILAVILLCAGGVAFAAWRIVDDGGDDNTAAASTEGESFQSQLEETTSEQGTGDAAVEGDVDAADSDVEAVDYQTGEDFSYTTPDQRYVTETQRHQNFFRAVAEGRVQRLEVTSADVRPVGDTNSSYIYFTLTTDSGTSNGTFVMKYAGGMWRIAAINQLSGDLAGGTNYMVPASFEEDLGREIADLQPFLTKVAEGRFAYMEVYSVNRPSDSESVLTGVVVGKSGKTVPAEMRLRKDYGIWHLVYITDPP
jgi:hypothetical protein